MRAAPWALGLMLLLSGCTLPFGPAGDRTGPGQRAGDYLKPRPHASVLLEVDFVQGAEPEQRALGLVEQRLESVSGKPVEVVRTPGVPAQGADHKSTRAEIEDLEARFRGQHSQGERAVLYVLYLDGGFEQDEDDRKTLGAAYRGSSVVMFKGNLRAASRSGTLDLGKPPLAEVEESVLVHELGHILGLVNCGTPMVTPHEDTEPGHGRCHSISRESVMYWAVEVSVIGSVLGQAPPDDFDADDRADLAAMRQG